MDDIEKRLTGAYQRALDNVRRIPSDTPGYARAVARMQKAQLALRRYQARPK